MKIQGALVIITCTALAGCAMQPGGQAGDFGGGNKTTAGTLLGAGVGGLAGSQIGHGGGRLAAVAAGTLLGALLGHEAGTSLDRADQTYAERAEQQAYAAPTGESITWNNPESGHNGSITPLREGTDQRGYLCREYQTTVNVGGRTQRAYGTACRQPDGSWRVVQ